MLEGDLEMDISDVLAAKLMLLYMTKTAVMVDKSRPFQFQTL